MYLRFVAFAPWSARGISEKRIQADNPARLSGGATQSLRSFKPFGFVDTETLSEINASYKTPRSFIMKFKEIYLLGGGNKMKVKALLVVLIIGLVLFTIWYFTPKNYTQTLNGVYYQLGNGEEAHDIEIILDGKLHHRFNGKITFKGTVEIRGTNVPSIPEDKTEIVLDYHGENRAPIFSAFRVVDYKGRVEPDIYYYGLLYTNDKFSEFTIAVFNDGDSETWSPSNGFMITAPARDKQVAIKISQNLMKKFDITLNP